MPRQTNRLWDCFKSALLFALPHHGISRGVYFLTRRRLPFTAALIRLFARHFKVDMSEAQSADPRAYACFNDFFTRALKPGLRPLPPEPDAIACPVDATVSQIGAIEAGRIIQAKGRDYTVQELLGGSQTLADRFAGGRFATLYLSPRDYHRIHMPVDGRLHEMIHVPGRLFSVAPYTTRCVERLFARNERVVTLFDTGLGPMALVLVGAINVAAIETAWAGLVTPPRGRGIGHWHYDTPETMHQLARGEEMGRFNMGSTVILLFADPEVQWAAGLAPETPVRMGQAIARKPSGTP